MTCSMRSLPPITPSGAAEIRDVLNRPRLARYSDPELRADVLDLLTAAAVWFDPNIAVTDCRDARDNRYLELAPAARASTLVSSDDDLLSMHPWRGVRILSPAAYAAEAT